MYGIILAEMISFESDYIEGAHPKILQKLAETNLEQLSGYGADTYTQSATLKIRKATQCPEADVFLLTGGTQTNATVIDSLLKSYEGAVCAQSGHINVHEAGAIEFSGHKVLALPSHDGKIDDHELETLLARFCADANREHMVYPGLVYISHPTEYGTLYTADQLRTLSKICHSYNIPLYLDGARLAYGLAARSTDVTLPLIAQLCDAFYIGGTKCGALCGEAVVFPHKAPAHFFTTVKQHGALLAKGRLLGIQFDTLFTDNLYTELGRHAIDAAAKLKEILNEKGLKPYGNSPTNQQFAVVENGYLKELLKRVKVDLWEAYDDTHTIIRFATSWATPDENLAKLRELL